MLALLLLSCIHSPVALAPSDVPITGRYEVLGRVEVRRCENRFLGVFPLGPRPTMRKLVDAAKLREGAVALTSITVDRTTFFWGLGTTECTILTANAVK